MQGNSTIVAMLLQHPTINVNAVGIHGFLGMGPLFLASAAHARVVRVLLRHPCIEVNATNAAGISSLCIACAHVDLPVVWELLGHPGLCPGSIHTAVTEAERLEQTAVVALLRGHWAGRRALRGWGGA